ncbi:MAG: aminotransferase class I/II-fold pyridoxal phosphate-dependent enzyme [Nitrospiraceae bacterium]|nr:aminotransferase class I/II-fold pyridoxal phosphate-dependent enzyme [Nitrospiraceae bacterium]
MLHGHGGDIYSLARELRRPPDTILDFSSNISPLPLPKGLKELLISHLDEIRYLPEVDSLGLREALARKFELSPGHFLIGAGTTDWIYSLPRTLRPDRVVIPLPTYSDYSDAAISASCPIETLGPWPNVGPQANAEILEALSTSANGHVLIYLCNPNNPTGRFIPTGELREVISRYKKAVWVVDESYAPFVAPDRESSLISGDLLPNLVVLRSFSKIYRIPGLRLGYAVSRAGLTEALASGIRPWAVSRLAQIAGEYLVDQTGYQEEVRDYCRKERRRLLSMLAEFPLLRPIDGVTQFILFRVLAPWTAAYLVRGLRKEGILIRDCTNFVGLEGEYVRISLKSEPEDDSLIKFLRKLNST